MLQASLTFGLSLAIIIALVVVALFWRHKGWFVQWVRGTSGFIMLAVAVWLAFITWDLWSYRSLAQEHPLTTVTIYKLSDQEYDLTLVDPEGGESRYVINGDQWQLDVRMLVWSGPLTSLGAEPLYRLDRLSGRYLSLEQERTDKRTVYSLADSRGFDVWSWLRDFDLWLDADFGSAVYMPLTNGAVYRVTRSARGLVARAVNDAAEDAVAGQW